MTISELLRRISQCLQAKFITGISGARGIGFVYEYSFDTNEHDKFQSYLLNATTMRKHLGGGFEFDKDRTYVITYEENSRSIVGIAVLEE